VFTGEIISSIILFSSQVQQGGLTFPFPGLYTSNTSGSLVCE